MLGGRSRIIQAVLEMLPTAGSIVFDSDKTLTRNGIWTIFAKIGGGLAEITAFFVGI